MGYCVLKIRGGEREKEYRRGVCVCVCVELDAVIDYGPLSLTGRHMETVTVFRYRHQYLLPPSFLPTFPPPFRKLFPKLFLSFICCYKFVIYEYSIIRQSGGGIYSRIQLRETDGREKIKYYCKVIF